MKNKDFSCEYNKTTESVSRKKTNKIIAWIVVTFVVCIAVLIICRFLFVKNSGSTSKAPTVLANNSEYTICRADVEASILKACGLPAELSSELAGTFVGYLSYDGEVYYRITEEQTDIVMYEYKPEPSTKAYIVLIGDTYCAAIRRDNEGFHGINGNFYIPDTQRTN